MKTSDFAPFEPILFSVGSFHIRWYSIAYIASFFAAYYLLQFVNNFTQEKLPKKTTDSLLNWCILGVILGGRLGYIIFYHPVYYLYNPLQIFALWNGGMSFHGGLLGVIITVIVYAQFTGISKLHLFDRAAFVTPVGLFFGRLANFINGELWGRETGTSYGVIFYNSPTLTNRHPSQLYEAFCEGLLIFSVLLFCIMRTSLFERRGFFSGVFLLIYATSRLIIEQFFREPDRLISPFGISLSVGQSLSFPMLLLGAILLAQAMLKTPKV